jgi:hypothetical protein
MKYLIGYLSLNLLLGLTLFSATTPEISQAATGAQQVTTCDTAELARLEADFQQMIKLRAEQPGVISDEAFEAAALAYTTAAENCFHALDQAKVKGVGEPVIIDEGGLSPYHGLDPRFNTTGRKWGNNSPYPGGQNVPGPGTSGGIVTYSYIPAGVQHVGIPIDDGGTNVNVLTSLGVNSCINSEFVTAFAAWSAISNIRFVQVADSGVPSNTPGATGHIRIGAHPMDGPSGTLAHGYFPPSTGDNFTSIAGDLHFDTAEAWSCNPGEFVLDIGIVALHEIGHTIGLNHEPVVLAVMNPFYNQDLVGLQQDDINGSANIYGPRAAIPPAPCIPLFNDTHEDGFANWSVSPGGGTPNNWQGKTDGKGRNGSANYWLVADVNSVSDSYLTSQSFNVTYPDLTLNFFHAIETEAGYDGGVVEISVNGGAFKDVGSANFTKNGYNLIISSASGNPLGGRPAFSGLTNYYRESSIRLGGLVSIGNNFRIRFREANDLGNLKPFAGWRLDDVKLCRVSRVYLPLIVRQQQQ